MVSSRCYAHSVDNGCNRRVGKANLTGAKGTHAPTHPPGAPFGAEWVPAERQVTNLRAPERRCHKSDTIYRGGDVDPRLDTKPARILAPWRPWRDGTWLGRITWVPERAPWCSRRREHAAQGDGRGDCKEGLYVSGRCHVWCALAAGGAQIALRAACRQTRALTRRKMRLCLDWRGMQDGA
jgi:hypothetical protein